TAAAVARAVSTPALHRPSLRRGNWTHAVALLTSPLRSAGPLLRHCALPWDSTYSGATSVRTSAPGTIRPVTLRPRWYPNPRRASVCFRRACVGWPEWTRVLTANSFAGPRFVAQNAAGCGGTWLLPWATAAIASLSPTSRLWLKTPTQ